MNILVINCGSSSLKYQLINSDSEEVLAKGLCERIGIDGSLTYQPEGGEKEKTDIPMPTHNEAISAVIAALTDEKKGVVKSLDEIGAVGHRVVHGGEKFTSSCLINDETNVHSPELDVKAGVASHKPYWMPNDPMYLPVRVCAAGGESLAFGGMTRATTSATGTKITAS